MSDSTFEDTVQNLLKMPPKRHEPKGEKKDGPDDPDRPRQPSDEG